MSACSTCGTLKLYVTLQDSFYPDLHWTASLDYHIKENNNGCIKRRKKEEKKKKKKKRKKKKKPKTKN